MGFTILVVCLLIGCVPVVVLGYPMQLFYLLSNAFCAQFKTALCQTVLVQKFHRLTQF